MATKPGLAMDLRIKQNVVVDTSGCWVWQLRLNNWGYGLIGIRTDGKPGTKSAHRVSFETFIGPVPDGLQLDHLCRNRACVNPAHLEPVTPSENVRRSPVHISVRRRAQAECARGHEFSPDNTYFDRQGYRHCRTCNKASAERVQARRRAGRTEVSR